MKLSYGDIKKALYVCAALAFLVSVHIVSVYVFAVQRFSITYDAMLTAQAHKEIESYIDSNQMAALKPNELDGRLRAAFPCVDSLHYASNPNGAVRLTLKAVKPLLKLDEGRLLTMRNDIVPSSYYSTEAVQSLPKLQLVLASDEKHLPNVVFEYVQRLDLTLVERATIFWKHNNDVHVVLADPRLRFICNEYIAPNKELLKSCTAIAHELNIQSSAQSMVADIRFADQIVVSRIKS